MAPPRRRRFARRLAALLAAALVVGVALALRSGRQPAPVAARCTFTAFGQRVHLGLAPAGYASTIAAVGERMGLPDHAVTVALATALQESGLADLPYGDRDSVGLFQQRPSQGWGSRSELLDPVYSANAFYSRLDTVPGWQSLPVAEAAQDVQRSADGAAYADWQDEARTMAVALTGEVPAGVSCRYPPPTGRSTTTASPALLTAAARELGRDPIGAQTSAKRGWIAAGWLVAHAAHYRLLAVSYDGRRWTAVTGRWVPDPAAGSGAVAVSAAS